LRLYLKLFSLIILTVIVQRCLLDSREPSLAWFEIRCHYAYTVNDSSLIRRLIAEENHRIYHADEPLYVRADQ